MNTQDSNESTQQSQINVSPTVEKLPREKGVKRLEKEARMVTQATTSNQQQETTIKVKDSAEELRRRTIIKLSHMVANV